MSDQHFPVLFTVGNSSKHEVILLDKSLSIQDLSSKIESTIAKSPNCVEALSKYAKNQSKLAVKVLKVRWSGEPREARLWPSATILTDENIGAALGLIALHQGKDIIEVEVEQFSNEKGDEKSENPIPTR
ncbi:hypothetical protein K461DRAFT_269054 [Myriangium duriaei CBS 260.36]|uniref:Uncharacterized protein n=1 Tax=Myriangium duriaei CBS 260.36 TaxID=1168546 RepID=A0A9P4J0A3_9PEZI|nr:hypothetical protein K461DRAFT_269054 [Myriangium duriaei CBS 260.36]